MFPKFKVPGTGNKMNVQAAEAQLISSMASMLASIYSNKSSDEYKSHGDITLSSEYHSIEKMIADLKTLHGYPQTEANDLKNLFETLHRPVFKKMVSEYIQEPNEKNTIFTTAYTVGFRLLVGELSRIYSSTKATDKGIEYTPSKVSKKSNANELIRYFNKNLEEKINNYIKSASKDPKNTEVDPVTEYALLQEGAVTDFAKSIVGPPARIICNVISTIFKTAKELNPISLINSVLNRAYNNKVQRFEDVAALYEETKKAYEEYMRIPYNDRKKKIECKYARNLEKYNIKMNNLRAAIEHYDQRSVEEAKDMAKSTHVSSTSSDNNSTPSIDDDNDSGFDF